MRMSKIGLARWPSAVVAILTATSLSSACWSASASVFPPVQSPQAIVDELLAADRAFSSASEKTTVVPALKQMFASDVIMQAPGGMMKGIDAAVGALNANPNNATSTMTWVPVRGGISSDGLHGFTYGYMTVKQADGLAVPVRYLAYWIKRDGRWQVAAYKRRVRPAGEISTAMLPAVLPDALVAPRQNSAAIEADRKTLIAAEQAFSDAAQKVGLGAAFTKFGWPEAMNMGGPNDVGFVIGNETIGRNIGLDSPTDNSPLYWSADEAIIASSGDLGVTFGTIKSHPVDGKPAPPPAPFFTIWRRVGGVWRYIAE